MLADLSVVGGVSSEKVKIRNLSPSGLMAEAGVVYAVGTMVTLMFRNLEPVNGRVVWSTDGRMGIAFDKEIDPRRARQVVGFGQEKLPDFLRAVPVKRSGFKTV